MLFWLGKLSFPFQAALNILQHPEMQTKSNLFEERFSEDSDPLNMLKPRTWKYKPQNKLGVFINDNCCFLFPLLTFPVWRLQQKPRDQTDVFQINS